MRISDWSSDVCSSDLTPCAGLTCRSIPGYCFPIMPDARLHLPPATTAPVTESILVIRHGGLRGIVQALGPLKAIRSYHPRARITLLTTAPYADFLRASGYADMVCSDPLQIGRASCRERVCQYV